MWRQIEKLKRAIEAYRGEGRYSVSSGGRTGYGGSITHGGLRNSITGQGGAFDKTESSFFVPTRFWWGSPL